MPDKSEREREIFGEALELGSLEERRAFIKGACGGDEALQRAVEGLLEAYSQAEGFIPTRLAAPPDASGGSTSVEGPGTRIGRYKLLQKIGEGGMGVVYMAQQEEPVRRRVALKIIKLGMDTKQVVARFEAERQALALMDHPNIARVFDAGVTAPSGSPLPSDPGCAGGSAEASGRGAGGEGALSTHYGRPYFVMELVQGVPITEFCDKNRLSAEQRLKMFIPVCQAIQSAHQKGIIHRDLKPTNILVTLNSDGSGFPKVIDFGVAKATSQKLTEKTLFTAYGMIVGTPAYMSPEQAEMSRLDVDTRADIYSLGALLYELLTGTPPFSEQRLRSAGYNEMQRIILEEQPVKPSTRLSTLQGEQRSIVARNRGASELTLGQGFPSDLDWIVMKCLEKDRARRYETANGLAHDIERHLRNEPITARPPSRLYEFQKAVRRHWVGFAAVAAVLAALSIGVVVSSVEALRARRAEREQIRLRVGEAEQRQRAEAGERRGEELLYAGKMRLVQAAWEQNRVAQVRQLLQETADYPDRGFEWYYWQRQAHSELRALRGHLGWVYAANFSPDGQRVATCSLDQTAKVWDVRGGKELVTLKGHLKGVTWVAFSPDGQRIATASQDTTAKLWGAAGGNALLTLRGHGDVIEGVGFSPDGRRVVTASWDGTARVWDAATGTELVRLQGHAGLLHDGVFSPDGGRIVTASEDGAAKVWDSATGHELLTLKGHSGAVQEAAFSQDGQRIVTSSDDRTAKVWDAATGQPLLTLTGHSQMVDTAQFSPDGQRILTSSDDQTARVWDAHTAKELLTLKGHDDKIEAAAFSPDGQRIATASDDNTAKIWDAATGQDPLTLKDQGSLLAVAYSPDSRQIVTGGYPKTAKVWDVAGGKVLLTLQGHARPVRTVAFSPDGRRIATGSAQTVKVWEAVSGTEALSVTGHVALVTWVAFSPDSRRLVSASADGTARVWDATRGNLLLTLTGHSNGVYAAAFSPDGGRIVTGSPDRTAKMWDAASGKCLLTFIGHSAGVWSVAFSPDGRRIVTAAGSAASAPGGPVAFSPEGQRIITGRPDHTARVWDAATGTNLLILKGHTAEVQSAAFSPDGRRVLTGSRDQTAKLWDAATGEELLTLKGHERNISGAAFSPDGQRIVTTSQDKTAKVWSAATAEQVALWQAEETQAAQRLAALQTAQKAAAEQERALHAQDPGALKQWLILAFLGFTADSGPQALAQEQIPHEAQLRPRAGEWIQVGGSERRWRAVQLDDYVIDFNELDRASQERSVAYAVCYIESETNETGLSMRLGSLDQSKVYLNGREIYRNENSRSYVPDQDVVSGVELKAGLNALVFKLVLNHRLDSWQGSIRFTDAAGQPVKGIRVTVTPPP
jgi:WD40 repeat protein/serine/threonine protein kinase